MHPIQDRWREPFHWRAAALQAFPCGKQKPKMIGYVRLSWTVVVLMKAVYIQQHGHPDEELSSASRSRKA